MKPAITKHNDIARIKGDLTIAHHASVVSLLRSLTSDACQKLVIDQPENIDLSTIQLLIALQRRRSATGQPIELIWQLHESQTALLRITGFSDFILTKQI